MRDPRVEQWLKNELVKWEYVGELPLMTINLDASLNNQARMTMPLIESTVARYAMAMRRGDEFPAIVVYPRKDQYVIITGNHRCAAAQRAGRLTLDAYVVRETDDLRLTGLTRMANGVEGMRHSEEEDVQHAVHLVTNYGMKLVDAAAKMNVDEDKVSKAYNQKKAVARLQALNVKLTGMTMYAIRSSARAQSDILAAKLADAALTYCLTNDQMDVMTRKCLAAGGEDAGQAAIMEFVQHPDIASQRKGVLGATRFTKATVAQRSLRALENLVKDEPFAVWGMSDPQERAQFRRRLYALYRALESSNDVKQ